MQEEKDYLQRDIERITLFLKIMLKRIAGLNDENFQPQYDELEKDLNEQVDFSLEELNHLNKTRLVQKIESMHLEHIEKLVEIAYEVVGKTSFNNKKKLVNNVLLMIGYIDEKSNTFSLRRLQIREELQKHA
jgi:hypothetical protein